MSSRTIPRACEYCSAPFFAAKFSVARGQGRWCSIRCSKLAKPRVAPADRLWARVNKNGPIPSHRPELGQCWEWTGATHDSGYGIIGLGGKRDGVERTHRLAWTIAHGSIPDGLFVCHACDNRLCCRPDHLFLGTALDNSHDMVSKGRERPIRGSANRLSKLTEEQVLEIRRLSAEGVGYRRLAQRFPVDRATIRNIIIRKKWAHI